MELRDLIRERSYTHLIEWLRYTALPAAVDEAEAEIDRARAVDLALIAYDELHRLLRLAIDEVDVLTFERAMQEWPGHDEHLELCETVDPQKQRLQSEQDRLVLGLVMWTSHKIALEIEPNALEALAKIWNAAAGRFNSGAQIRVALERARANDSPWTDWFLSELPAGQAHFIPTTTELIRAAVLLSLALDLSDPRETPFPSDILLYQSAELERHLESIAASPDRWKRILGAPESAGQSQVEDASIAPEAGVRGEDEAFRARIERARAAVRDARQLAEAASREAVRESPLDTRRTEEFRSAVLDGQRKARVVRETLALRGCVLPAPADLNEPTRALKEWIPKSWFTPESNVVGIDLAARDLVRPVRQEEISQFLAALPEQPVLPLAAGQVQNAVLSAVTEMRQAGLDPSLLLIPLSWRLSHELVPANSPTRRRPHRWIPESFEREFEGAFDGEIPVLDRPDVPGDRFYLVDLRATIRMYEWDSDDDSGVRYSLVAYDEGQARALLAEQPGIKPEGKTVDEVVDDLQEQLLLELRIRWQIERAGTEGIQTFGVPPELRREP